MKYFLTIFCLFSITLITSNAQSSVIIEIEDTKYKVELMKGTFPELQEQLIAQDWWNNLGLARDIAFALGGSLGMPNAGDGPYFAFNQAEPNDLLLGIVTCWTFEGNKCAGTLEYTSPGIEVGNFDYAKATIVPIPAAAWLFMSGLLGLAWKSHKARQSVP